MSLAERVELARRGQSEVTSAKLLAKLLAAYGKLSQQVVASVVASPGGAAGRGRAQGEPGTITRRL